MSQLPAIERAVSETNTELKEKEADLVREYGRTDDPDYRQAIIYDKLREELKIYGELLADQAEARSKFSEEQHKAIVSDIKAVERYEKETRPVKINTRWEKPQASNHVHVGNTEP